MTAIMGRMATYSGKVIKWDEAINSKRKRDAGAICVGRGPAHGSGCGRQLSHSGARQDGSAVIGMWARI